MLLDDIWIKAVCWISFVIKIILKSIPTCLENCVKKGLNKMLHCTVEEMYLTSHHFKLGLFLSFFLEKREPDTVFEEKRKKWRSNSFNLESTWSPVDWQKKPHWSHFFHEQYRTAKPPCTYVLQCDYAKICGLLFNN